MDRNEFRSGIRGGFSISKIDYNYKFNKINIQTNA
jgi:hypothetical protein